MQCRENTLIAILTIKKKKKNAETFYEKQLQKRNQTGFIVEKVIDGEGDNLYVKWKDYDICLIVG